MADLRRVSSSTLLPYTIPNCVARQVIAGAETPLSSGDLTLQLPTVTHAQTPSTSSPKPVLLAFLGSTLFPLYKTTNFGTFTQSPRTYGFDFQLSQDTSTQVRLVLPDDVQADVQDQFEQILIHYGLLLEGIRAAGDEVMRSATEGGKLNSEQIRRGVQTHISTTKAVGDNPMTFGSDSHDRLASINQASNTVYRYAAGASSVVASAAGSAGASIKAGIDSLSAPAEQDGQGEKPVAEMGDMRRALNEAASGVSAGASNIAGTAQEAASQVITHGYGEETQRVAASAGDSMKQMGKAVGSTIHSASLTGVGEYAVVGALKDPKESAGGDA